MKSIQQPAKFIHTNWQQLPLAADKNRKPPPASRLTESCNVAWTLVSVLCCVVFTLKWPPVRFYAVDILLNNTICPIIIIIIIRDKKRERERDSKGL